jgi:hypothetical protein
MAEFGSLLGRIAPFLYPCPLPKKQIPIPSSPHPCPIKGAYRVRLEPVPITAITLRRTQAYVDSANGAMLLQNLGHIAEIDRLAEAEKASLQGQVQEATRIGCIAFAIVFGAIFFGGFFGAVSLFLIAPAVVVTIVFFYRAYQFHQKAIYEGQLDFPNHRYRLPQRLIPILKRDMTLNRKIAIALDFTPPDKRSKFQREVPHPRRRGWKIEYFADPWLTLQGRFADGTRFALKVIQRHEIRSGRNVNGKLRVRPRFKGFDLQLDLTCSLAISQALNQLPALGGAVKLPQGVYLKGMRPTPHGLRMKVRLPGERFPAFVPESVRRELMYRNPVELNPDAISQANQDLEEMLYQTSLLMFMSSYQVVNLVRVRGG